jgi:hypothetical protein
MPCSVFSGCFDTLAGDLLLMIYSISYCVFEYRRKEIHFVKGIWLCWPPCLRVPEKGHSEGESHYYFIKR